MVDILEGTVIGESIVVSGNLSGDEDLTVVGRVEGSIELTRTLIVEHSGIIKADISVRNAVISGVVVGNVEATDSVELTEAGRMVGDIRAPRVIIVDGARFRGTVDMGDLDAPRASAPLPARKERPQGAALARSNRPSAVPDRRPPPPPPSASKPEEAEPTVKVAAPKSKARAARPAKKKLKKKVVVKKKGR